MKRFKSFLLENAVQWTPLQHSDFTKYLKRGNSKRFDIFLDKIKNKKEFLTTKGDVIIKGPPLDREEFGRDRFTREFDTNRGKVFYPGDFYKTPEFGGKGKDSQVAAENKALDFFRNELDKAMIENQGGALDMLIGGRKVVVTGIDQPKGTPKADFYLIDDRGEQTAWLSHKAGKKSSDFQQYGGLTDKGTGGVFMRNKQVLDFVEKLKELYPDGMKSGNSVYRQIKLNKDGKDIARKSIYGIDYGKERGLNNIDEFHQGDMKLVKKGKYYVIKSAHSAENGYVPTDDYKCILYARFTQNMHHFGIRDTRTGIFASTFPSGKAIEI